MVFSMSNRLKKSDWVQHGLKSLTRNGIDAVRVERLARDLSVTKGSFYWHFKDRNALLNAMLAEWKRRATGAVIDEVRAQGGSATQQLRTLFEIVTQADGRLDIAIRTWAAHDKMAARALRSIDQQRLQFTEQLFCDVGFSKSEARARSRFAYNALIGQYTMGVSGAARSGADFEAVFAMLTNAPTQKGQR